MELDTSVEAGSYIPQFCVTRNSIPESSFDPISSVSQVLRLSWAPVGITVDTWGQAGAPILRLYLGEVSEGPLVLFPAQVLSTLKKNNDWDPREVRCH